MRKGAIRARYGSDTALWLVLAGAVALLVGIALEQRRTIRRLMQAHIDRQSAAARRADEDDA